jgi:hypothetical protein
MYCNNQKTKIKSIFLLAGAYQVITAYNKLFTNSFAEVSVPVVVVIATKVVVVVVAVVLVVVMRYGCTDHCVYCELDFKLLHSAFRFFIL